MVRGSLWNFLWPRDRGSRTMAYWRTDMGPLVERHATYIIRLARWFHLRDDRTRRTFSLLFDYLLYDPNLVCVQITLNLLAQIIPGTLLPGNPLANMVFKAYSVQTLTEATMFVQDLKLGHYVKVPPRATFLGE